LLKREAEDQMSKYKNRASIGFRERFLPMRDAEPQQLAPRSRATTSPRAAAIAQQITRNAA